MIDKWSKNIQPGVCLLCGDAGRGGRDLCAGCEAELPVVTARCGRCAIPLPQGMGDGQACGSCQLDPPPFHHCLAAFDYAAPLDYLLLGLKFGERLVVARSLGGLMLERLASQIVDTPELLMPVPLHPSRLRERGFTQSLELARPLARRLGLPLDVQACRRQRNTPPQAELSARHRQRNIKGAFVTQGRLDGCRIAIIDDVMTTGSTVREMARTLLAAGAAEVQVWVCARADTDRQ